MIIMIALTRSSKEKCKELSLATGGNKAKMLSSQGTVV